MEQSELDNRLREIETRLARMESLNGIKAPARKSATAPQDGIPILMELPVSSPAAKSSSGNWLGMVAVVCFVLAAGFIIQLSITSGWLTPIRQIGLATLLGFALIGAGFVVTRHDKAYAGWLPAAGIIVLYLTSFAAHVLYHLVPFHMALAAVSMVSGLCIWLYMRLRHDFYAVTAAIGAYAAPFLLNADIGAAFLLYYGLMCSVAFATISVMVKSRTLTLVASFLAMLTSGHLATPRYHVDDMALASILALHFVLFSGATYLYTRVNKTPLTTTEANCLLPILLVFYWQEFTLFDRVYPDLAPWISLGFAGILIGLYMSAKKYFPNGLGSQTLIVAFTTIVAVHAIYFEILPDDIRPWLFTIFVLVAAFMPPFKMKANQSNIWQIPVIALVLIMGNEYIRMISHMMLNDDSSWLMMTFAGLASLWLFIVRDTDHVLKRKTYGSVLLVAAHLMAVTALYRITNDVSSIAVSASWLFYAVGVMVFAFLRKDEVMAKSALLVLAFAAGKALLYDAASAPTLVRIACLLLTGGVLYGCGLSLRKFSAWTKK